MKSNYKIIITILVIGTFLFGCTDNKIGSQTRNTPYINNMEGNSKLLDTSKCDNIEDVSNKSYILRDNKYLCYLNLAREKQDIAVCNQIEDKAILDGFSIRDGISIKAQCYSMVAATKKDLSVCDSMQIDNGTQISNDLSMKTKNFWISYKFDVDLYKDYCHKTARIINKDVDSCNKIEIQYQKDACYSSIAKDDISACDKIDTSYAGGKFTAGGCYSYIALKKNDVSICNKPRAQFSRDVCFRFYAQNNKITDFSVCDQIQNLSFKDDCYKALEVYSQNSERARNVHFYNCDSEQNLFIKDNCYAESAQGLNDISVCERIKTQKSSDYCYYRLALERTDVFMCDHIQTQIAGFGLVPINQIPEFLLVSKEKCFSDIVSISRFIK